MKHFLPTLFFVLFGIFLVQAQQWQDFTSQSRVKNMHIAGDMAYVATMGGMIEYNLATGQSHIFTKANSGLASDAVEVIKTEDAGTIWIGTYDAGITSFDGQKWITYNADNSPLPGNVILALAIDKDNNKWVGTNKGLVKIEKNGWTIYDHMTSPMTDDNVWALDIDADGSVWIGCITGSYLLKNGQWTDFSSEVPMYGVNGMACMPDGEVFNSGVGGVFAYKSGAWTNLSATGPDGLHNARKALRTADGQVWVATDYDGLFRFDGAHWTGGTASTETQYHDNGTITVDEHGVLYAAGSAGISRLNSSGWQQLYQSGPRLYDNYVKSIASDLSGKIWVAHSNAIASYNGSQWSYFTSDNSALPQGTVTRIRTEKPGVIWICTSAGVIRKESDKWQLFNNVTAGFGANEVLDVAFDSKGIAWVSHENGLSSFDGRNWTNYGKPARYSEYERGSVIACDKNNTIWIGTNMGRMVSFANGQWNYYSFEEKTFPGGYVMDLAVDHDGILWAATWGNNICYFDGLKWAILQGKKDVSASALAVTKNGNLWAASSYPAAITKYEGQVAADVFNNSNSPISGRTVNALTIDENGNLWIGTSSGLVVYSDNSAGINETGITGLNLNVYPNPCVNKTTISIELKKPSEVVTKIIDVAGKTVRENNDHLSAGIQSLNMQTSNLAPGSYILEVKGADISARKKLVIVR